VKLTARSEYWILATQYRLEMASEHAKEMEVPRIRDEEYPDVENEPLLPFNSSGPASTHNSPTNARFSLVHMLISFLLGALVQFLISRVMSGSLDLSFSSTSAVSESSLYPDPQFVPPYVGSTEVDQYPPTRPTGTDPSLFPSNVGHAGPTPTGAEPALLVTAPVYPVHSGAPGLLVPTSIPLGNSDARPDFDLLKYWGNLSPWYSNKKGAFGVDSGPEPPETCRVTGLHLLHRHGARYPTGWGVSLFRLVFESARN
jgi:hypothetical protein